MRAMCSCTCTIHLADLPLSPLRLYVPRREDVDEVDVDVAAHEAIDGAIDGAIDRVVDCEGEGGSRVVLPCGKLKSGSFACCLRVGCWLD